MALAYRSRTSCDPAGINPTEIKWRWRVGQPTSCDPAGAILVVPSRCHSVLRRQLLLPQLSELLQPLREPIPDVLADTLPAQSEERTNPGRRKPTGGSFPTTRQ